MGLIIRVVTIPCAPVIDGQARCPILAAIERGYACDRAVSKCFAEGILGQFIIIAVEAENKLVRVTEGAHRAANMNIGVIA